VQKPQGGISALTVEGSATPTLNIKSPRVYELARELSEATGRSMTSAIEVALEEMLVRVNRRKRAADDTRRAEIDAIVARAAPLLKDLPDDPTAFLYDNETGLPR
jgi:antitoxin VapB